jgi:hypothetical protein
MSEKFTFLKKNLNCFVLIMQKLFQCPEPLQSGSNAAHVINCPTTFAPD